MIPAIGLGPLGAGEWSVGGVQGAGSVAPAVPTSGSGSFSDALTSAIGSLDGTQNAASAAAQGLATGTATDPVQAITSVENAQLAMDYAAQIRNQLDTDATTLFQTQV